MKRQAVFEGMISHPPLASKELKQRVSCGSRADLEEQQKLNIAYEGNLTRPLGV
jgi:hypothetical protein